MSGKTQLDKIIAWAEDKIGSRAYHGICQAFVARAYEAGTGSSVSMPSAKEARDAWMKKGTENDLAPPRGAAVYFYGTPKNGFDLGHVALSLGGGKIIDPIDTVVKANLTKSRNGGYLGWGWNGNIIPEGADENSNYGGTDAETSVEITKVTVKSEWGKTGIRTSSHIGEYESGSDIFLLIQGDDRIYKPLITDDIKVSWEMTGSPGKMTFSCVDTENMKISEGNAVSFRYKNKKIFYGYIFILERSSDREEISVTCYDQLRYFKNQDSFVYNKKYSDLLKYICRKYSLKTGTIEDTGYKIPERIAEGTLFDICSEAFEETILNNGGYYILYDDFGEICLREIKNMITNVMIDRDTAGEWTCQSSIDSDVYNRIIIESDNSETGEREQYIANDEKTQSKWGILSYTESADEGASTSVMKTRAEALLKYYNKLSKTFRVSKCLGSHQVRGGSFLLVNFYLGNGQEIKQLMMTEKVEHSFSENLHTMDLNLIGGDYI